MYGIVPNLYWVLSHCQWRIRQWDDVAKEWPRCRGPKGGWILATYSSGLKCLQTVKRSTFLIHVSPNHIHIQYFSLYLFNPSILSFIPSLPPTPSSPTPRPPPAFPFLPLPSDLQLRMLSNTNQQEGNEFAFWTRIKLLSLLVESFYFLFLEDILLNNLSCFSLGF